MPGENPNGQGKMVNNTNDKEKTPIDDKPKGKKPIDSRTKEGKKKCIKKIVYYETDSSTSSSPRAKRKPLLDVMNTNRLNLNLIIFFLIILAFVEI
jgi:hypothetical protein